MPRTPNVETVRQRAHERALATLAAVEAPIEEKPVPEIEEQELSATEGGIETPDEPQPERPRGRPVKASTHRGPDEDFFEYLNRIDPKDWSSGRTSGLYIYKLQAGGNLPLTRPALRRAISADDLRDLAIKHGPGSYKLQFQTKLPHLTPCTEVIPFDADSLPSDAGPKGRQGNADFQGINSAISSTAEMLKDGAKTAIEISKAVQIENNRQPDMAGLVTSLAQAFAAMQPKPEPRDDSTAKLIMAMLENQAKEAERRAEAAERRAEEQRRLDREDAERRERQAKEDAERARERDQMFFDLMLSQANSKADSLNQMTGLLSNFIKVKNEIDDSLGGGPKGPWDLVGSVAERVLDVAPGIVAAMKGAPPQQVAQMVNPQPPQQDAQPFYDMVIRLAKYFQRDPANYEGPYLVDMIEKEYGAVFSEIMNQPKDAILQAVGTFEPYGKAIMEHAQAAEMLGKVIDAIKTDVDAVFPEQPDDDEDEIPVENPPMIHGKARRVNGRAKVVA